MQLLVITVTEYISSQNNEPKSTAHRWCPITVVINIAVANHPITAWQPSLLIGCRSRQGGLVPRGGHRLKKTFPPLNHIQNNRVSSGGPYNPQLE